MAGARLDRGIGRAPQSVDLAKMIEGRVSARHDGSAIWSNWKPFDDTIDKEILDQLAFWRFDSRHAFDNRMRRVFGPSIFNRQWVVEEIYLNRDWRVQ